MLPRIPKSSSLVWCPESWLGCKRANLLKVSLVATAAVLAACLLMSANPWGKPAQAQTAIPEATLVGAGDIAGCSYIRDDQTALLVNNVVHNANAPVTVFTLGDNAYPDGTRAQFANCYDNYRLSDGSIFDTSRTSYWGQFKERTMPALGNHEYHTSGAQPYFDYFSAVNGFKPPPAPVPNTTANPGLTPGKGYYSYDRGSWHFVVLNSNCSEVGGCGTSSPQTQWLKADLAAHSTSCTAAAFHHPLFFSGGADTVAVRPFWKVLYEEGADVILSGHAHYYERFAPQDPQGNKDLDYGIRELVSGTGGALPINPMRDPRAPNSEVDSEKSPGVTAYGVLKLDIYASSYDWEFIPRQGESFTDSGSDQCHGKPDTTPPEIEGVSADMNVTATSAQGATATYDAPTATDDVDGDVPVRCTPESGTVFPLGTTTVTCTATDSRGNTATASFKVSVTYAWSGVLQPLNPDGSSIFKLGSTVPVKFRLTGDSAGITDAVAKLYVAKISDGVAGEEVEALSTAAAIEGNYFRYDPTSEQYIFNWSTKALETGAGTYRLRIELGDQTTNTVLVSLRQ
jgi:hypothetical protein